MAADGYYPQGGTPFDLEPGGPVNLGDIHLEPRSGPEEKEGGIGIMFSGDPDGIRVIQFAENSPAREAGMEVGDLITAINGVDAGREPIVNWVVNLRGPPGTPVVLEVVRGTSQPFSVTVIRRNIGLRPVPRPPGPLGGPRLLRRCRRPSPSGPRACRRRPSRKTESLLVSAG